jgi:hypothetical protein
VFSDTVFGQTNDAVRPHQHYQVESLRNIFTYVLASQVGPRAVLPLRLKYGSEARSGLQPYRSLGGSVEWPAMSSYSVLRCALHFGGTYVVSPLCTWGRRGRYTSGRRIDRGMHVRGSRHSSHALAGKRHAKGFPKGWKGGIRCLYGSGDLDWTSACSIHLGFRRGHDSRFAYPATMASVPAPACLAIMAASQPYVSTAQR